MDSPGNIGPYRLIEQIGRGGMGEVWLADDPTGAAGSTPRRVAVKLIDPAMVDDPDWLARFAREVEAATRVHSPHVARLLDADLSAARPWLASTYVAGPTLGDHVVRHGPLAMGALRALGAALAEALVAIHDAGVVHRDLTPGNVVLGPDGPCVVDFGIAWLAGAAPITQAGSSLGTPAWMPPERLVGVVTSPAGDVWSWGALMVYAATGRPPVGVAASEDPQFAAAGRAAGDETGGLDVDVAGVPEWLEPTVTAAMATDPRARPTARALLAVMEAPGSRAPASAPTRPDGAPTRVLPGDTGRAGGAPTQAASTDPTRAFEDPPTAPPGAADPVPARAGTGGRRSRQPWLRWLVGLALVAAAAAVGQLAGLLVTILVVAVLLLVAVGLRLARENDPKDDKPAVPTWGFVVAAPVALGVGVAQYVGPVGGAGVVLALIVLFVLLGGDIG